MEKYYVFIYEPTEKRGMKLLGNFMAHSKQANDPNELYRMAKKKFPKIKRSNYFITDTATPEPINYRATSHVNGGTSAFAKSQNWLDKALAGHEAEEMTADLN